MFKKAHALMLLGMLAPVSSFATSHYCIEVSGGFGKGGETFVGANFTVPAEGSCAPWAGFTKAYSSVIMNTTGSGCLSSDGKILTFILSSADPEFLGAGGVVNDYIRMCPAGTKSCPIGGGTDRGNFSGPAAPETCPSNVLSLPGIHD